MSSVVPWSAAGKGSMAQTLDRYLHQESRLHRLDPRIKIVVTFAFVLATLLLPDGAWAAFALSWLCIWWASRQANLPYRVVFTRSLVILPFLITALTLLINTPGNVLLHWSGGPVTVAISDAGLVRFASVMTRGWLAVQAAILLTAVTQFPDLMHALNHLRVPAILVSIVSFMYRYLFVLGEEVQRMLRARQARSARLPGSGQIGGSIGWRARIAGQMVGQLFLRSLDRSDRVYQAMIARGYQGRMLTMNPHELTRHDWLAGVAALVWIVLIQLIARIS